MSERMYVDFNAVALIDPKVPPATLLCLTASTEEQLIFCKWRTIWIIIEQLILMIWEISMCESVAGYIHIIVLLLLFVIVVVVFLLFFSSMATILTAFHAKIKRRSGDYVSDNKKSEFLWTGKKANGLRRILNLTEYNTILWLCYVQL